MKRLMLVVALLSVVTLPSFADDPPPYLFQWGSFGSGDGQFNSPLDIVVDQAGYVYVADTQNHRIQKFTRTGEFVRSWGQFGTLDGQFRYPCAVCTDGSGHVYVADPLNDRVQKFTSDGAHIATWTTPLQGGRPSAVATDIQGNVYIADATNSRVIKCSSDGQYLLAIAADAAPSVDGLGVSDSGDIYITDVESTPGQSTILHYRVDGSYVNRYGCSGGYPTPCAFSHPNAVAVDEQGNFYVVDNDWFRVKKHTSTGELLTLWGTWGNGNGQFDQPYGVAYDRATSWVYVAEEFNHRVQVFGVETTPVSNTSWGRLKTLYR